MTKKSMKPVLQQLSSPLELGDIIRVLDKDHHGAIAVCVESDGHPEYPYCCMIVSLPEEARVEFWPARYERIGNVNEVVRVLHRPRAVPAKPPTILARPKKPFKKKLAGARR